MDQQREVLRNLLCGLSLEEVRDVRASYEGNAANILFCNQWIVEMMVLIDIPETGLKLVTESGVLRVACPKCGGGNIIHSFTSHPYTSVFHIEDGIPCPVDHQLDDDDDPSISCRDCNWGEEDCFLEW